MKTENFIQAVDEIRKNGGSRKSIFVKEYWRNREMTVFGYNDGTAEVFENARPFISFNSMAEALFFIDKMQADYNKDIEESVKYGDTNNIVVDTYTNIADYYAKAPRGTYFGD